MTLKFQWYIQKVLALMHRPQTLKLLLELVKKYLVPCSKHFLISLWLHVCSFSFAFAHNFHNIDMSKPLLKENKMMVFFFNLPHCALNIHLQYVSHAAQMTPVKIELRFVQRLNVSQHDASAVSGKMVTIKKCFGCC